MNIPVADCFLRLLLLLSIGFCACETPVHVSVTEGKAPQFICDYPNRLSDLVIFRIPDEYLGKGGFPGEILDDRTAVWEIYGVRDEPRDPITYGVVPRGMKERVVAKPLQEGAYYLVMCGQNGNGGCYGTTFVVENGKAVKPNN